MYEKLKTMWELKYITVDSLRKWVSLNERNPKLGITADQFKDITGLDC